MGRVEERIDIAPLAIIIWNIETDYQKQKLPEVGSSGSFLNRKSLCLRQQPCSSCGVRTHGTQSGLLRR